MTHENHLDDEIVFIVTLQPVVLWINKNNDVIKTLTAVAEALRCHLEISHNQPTDE